MAGLRTAVSMLGTLDPRADDISAADNLRNLFESRTDKTMFIVGAPTVRYQEIIDIIDAGAAAGAKIGIITEGMHREAATAR